VGVSSFQRTTSTSSATLNSVAKAKRKNLHNRNSNDTDVLTILNDKWVPPCPSAIITFLAETSNVTGTDVTNDHLTSSNNHSTSILNSVTSNTEKNVTSSSDVDMLFNENTSLRERNLGCV
ncbi:unnamed protein product, partial [Rotaria sp. Silwood2]